MTSHSDQSATRQEKPRDIQQKAKTLTDDVSELFELYYKLAVVTATEKASNAAALSITFIILIFLLMFALLFIGLGIGYYLGQRLNNMLAGFTIIAGFFALLIGLTLTFRKSFLFPLIRNTVIKKVYES
jgi:cytochrome c biogenesis protein CcdA